MEKLENMKDQLIDCVQAQFGNLRDVDTKELGDAIDMIKDLAEAIYYCEITKAMRKPEKKKENKCSTPVMYVTDKYNYPYYGPEMYGWNERAYYSEDNYNKMQHSKNNMPHSEHWDTNSMSSEKHNQNEHHQEKESRDSREGASPIERVHYIESKESHMDKAVQMKHLENYIQHLSKDILEMMKNTSQEERQLLQSNMQMLSVKIGQMNG